MVDSGALVKQKRFKLHLLHVIERIKNDCQELEEGETTRRFIISFFFFFPTVTYLFWGQDGTKG